MSTDVTAIKQAAVGRWSEILTALGSIPAEVNDGNHHPCPKCGGVDRFRAFDDFAETGGVYCNQCHAENNSDGISTLQWANGIDFKAVVKLLADYLGIQNGNGKAKPNGKAKKGIDFRQIDESHLDDAAIDKIFGQFCAAKPPITVAGIRKCGGRFVRWMDHRCIALSGRKNPRDKGASAVVLLTIDGKVFPATKTLSARKTHTVAGSVNSWLSSGSAEELQQASTILDVEGVTDLLAVVSAGLPDGWVAVTNTAGAKARGRLSREWAKSKPIIVVGDADEPGQDGQTRSAAAYHKAGAMEIFLTQLPYPIEKDHGKDIRDYLNEGHKIENLPRVQVSTAEANAWNKAKVISHSSEPFPLTDTGLAERFALQHGDDVRYCHAWGKYIVWDGTHWKIDDGGAVDQRGKQTVRSIFHEAADEPDDERREAIAKFSHASESIARRSAMLTLAKSEPPIPIAPDVLDTNHWVLNCPNGRIDLHTGQLCGHRREDYITKLCPIAYNPKALCPTWLTTLDTCFGRTYDLIDYVQRFAGYCLSGDVSEQILNIWHGIGANGKSTILNALMEMMGPDYSMKATADLLLMKRDSDHPTALTDLHGKRLVACIETDDGRRLAEALVKELTGGDPIRARRMREDFWQFMPTHKVVLACNHRPTVRGTDHAIWRRLKLVPFNVVIPPKEREKQLSAKLRDELPGILAWSVRGCLDWQQYGLGEPKAVIEATANYQNAEDTLATFISECCIIGDNMRAKASDVLDTYRSWSGDKHMTTRKLTAILGDRGIGHFRSNGVNYRLGLLDERTDGRDLPYNQLNSPS